MHDIYKKFPVIVGLRVSDAMPLIKSKGFTPRFYQALNKKSGADDSFMAKRVNLLIQKGIIAGYAFF